MRTPTAWARQPETCPAHLPSFQLLPTLETSEGGLHKARVTHPALPGCVVPAAAILLPLRASFRCSHLAWAAHPPLHSQAARSFCSCTTEKQGALGFY